MPRAVSQRPDPSRGRKPRTRAIRSQRKLGNARFNCPLLANIRVDCSVQERTGLGFDSLRPHHVKTEPEARLYVPVSRKARSAPRDFTGSSLARFTWQAEDLIDFEKSSSIIAYKKASVAQPVEQGPLKPKVLGSTPSRRTMMESPSTGDSFFSSLAEISWFDPNASQPPYDTSGSRRFPDVICAEDQTNLSASSQSL